MPKIRISHPDGDESKFGLQGKIFKIGRAPDNDIQLPDGSSSNYHAVLKLADSGDYTLSDLGSTNHTRINGKRITARELRDGDHILFGDTLAIYESDVTHDSPPPADDDEAPAESVKKARPEPVEAPKKKSAAKPATPSAGQNEPPPAAPAPQSGGCLGLIIAVAIVATTVGAALVSALS